MTSRKTVSTRFASPPRVYGPTRPSSRRAKSALKPFVLENHARYGMARRDTPLRERKRHIATRIGHHNAVQSTLRAIRTYDIPVPSRAHATRHKRAVMEEIRKTRKKTPSPANKWRLEPSTSRDIGQLSRPVVRRRRAAITQKNKPGVFGALFQSFRNFFA